MIRLTFSPAIVCGQSLNWFPIGMPRPEAGPVSDSVTPMLTSAMAVVASSAARQRGSCAGRSWLSLREGEGCIGGAPLVRVEAQ